jgi:hypothetical protein
MVLMTEEQADAFICTCLLRPFAEISKACWVG